ncbi:hypothetical protein [Actinomadura yumaensis]|uniref:Uncharacterized protein n=1 Tax=Actinomadura yumaensis TaxID=111807 RepID=A0ABW2CDV6_9ACTN
MPPWANRVAHLVPFTVLPSGVWRIALGLGVPVGFHGELADLYHAPDWRLTPYVFALSLLAEGCALLTLGLVRPWGEVFPRWLPFVGGRNVPVPFAVALASAGAVAVTLLCTTMLFQVSGPDAMGDPDAPRGLAAWVMGLCYAPMLLWGPLLAVVTAAYYLRRRGLTPSPTGGRGRTRRGTAARP